MVLTYYAIRARYNNESMIMHRFIPGQSTAETILSMLRPDRQFTAEEARMLDIMLCLHAEHGGGNNSSFTTHVLTSARHGPVLYVRRGDRIAEGPQARWREPSGSSHAEGDQGQRRQLGKR